MNKLAIFVEGQTELLFVENLLLNIANVNQLAIELFRAAGGSAVPLRFKSLKLTAPGGSQHYVQIVDCTSDGNVKPYIQERYANLVAQNYWGAVGIRDVYPSAVHGQVASLRAGLANGISTRPVNVYFVLGVMEIEAWFIAENAHFIRLDPRLTNAAIVATMGFDPTITDIQQRPNPADDLDKIYQIAGLRYTKRRSNCLRTLQNLDYARIYCELINRFPDLLALTHIIDEFLALA